MIPVLASVVSAAAVGTIVGAVVGFAAGALVIFKLFQIMHNNSLPPKPKG